MKRMKFSINKRSYQKIILAIIVVAVASIGIYSLMHSHAASSFVALKAGNGALTGVASKQSDGSIQFGIAGNGGTGSNMIVGLDAGGWGTTGAQIVAYITRYARIDATSEPVSDFSNVGVKLIIDFPSQTATGEYNGQPVSSINVTTWTSNALNYYKANCTVAECPIIEILNEPVTPSFFGNNNDVEPSEQNYVSLLKAVNTAFTAAYPSGRPLILASYDGGSSASTHWGQAVWQDASSMGVNLSSIVDGITLHPYGGHGSAASSAAGNTTNVANAYSQTHVPVYITEVGWPTDIGSNSSPSTVNETGDSLQWSTLDQCNNIYNFITWARGTGYIKAVMIYNYKNSFDSNYQYGIATIHGDKPSRYGLQDAIQGLPNNCVAHNAGFQGDNT
jgi:hypothetical protein